MSPLEVLDEWGEEMIAEATEIVEAEGRRYAAQNPTPPAGPPP